MSGLFENLAATDDSQYIANRKASAVAVKRVRDQFGEFLANSADAQERRARVALVEDEVTEIIREVVSEYGGDVDKLSAAIRHSMMPGQMGPGGNPTPGMPGGAAGMHGGSGVCPQCGGPMLNGQCPTCQQGGAMAAGGAAGAPAGAYGLTHSIPQAPSTGPVQASHEAKGGFCDECHNWKSGPKAGCTCGTDSDDGDNDADDQSGEESHEAHTANDLSIKTHPIMHAEPLPDEPGKEGVLDIDGELAKAPSAVGRGELTTATVKEAEALTTVDLPTGDESALGGPSPKIDKGNSGDNFGWSLDPIDTQMDGSPHPTVEQDPTEAADYVNKDFLDQTDAVTETVELDSAPDLMNDAGFAPGGEEHGPHTDTWSGQGGQATPVTREALSRVAGPGHGPIDDPAADPYGEADYQQMRHQIPPQAGGGTCPNCNGPADGPPCPHCGFDASHGGDPSMTYGGGHAMDDPDPELGMGPYRAATNTECDPDKNPLRELVEDYDGWLMPNQVEAALKSWQVG